MIRAEEKHQFLVTLPSNACDDRYPNNRPGNYKTRLPVPVELNDDWEVALVDVQYPQSWYNFVHKTRVALAIQLDPKGTPVTITPDTNKPFKLPSGLTAKTRTKDQTFQHNVNETTSTSGKLYSIATEVVPGHYDSVTQFGESLAHQFTDILDGMYPPKRHKLAIKYKMDPTNTYSVFDFENITKAYFFCDNPYAMSVLGYEPAATYGSGTDADPYVYQYLVFGASTVDVASVKRPCNLSRAFSIYVYSDIIKSQIVGDVQAPLLGVVPVVHPASGTGARTADKLQYWCFNPTYYMPLRLSRFDTVDILLATDEGLEVVFANPIDKVVCRLHFQRRPPSGI